MRMQAPADTGDTCSHNGEIYEIDANGIVDLPAHAAAALEAHGFRAVGDVKPARSPAEGNPLQTRSTLATDRDAALRSVDTADRELLLKMCQDSGIEVKAGHNDSHLRKKLRDYLDERLPAAPVGDGVVDLRKAGDDSFGPKVT